LVFGRAGAQPCCRRCVDKASPNCPVEHRTNAGEHPVCQHRFPSSPHVQKCDPLLPSDCPNIPSAPRRKDVLVEHSTSRRYVRGSSTVAILKCSLGHIFSATFANRVLRVVAAAIDRLSRSARRIFAPRTLRLGGGKEKKAIISRALAGIASDTVGYGPDTHRCPADPHPVT